MGLRSYESRRVCAPARGPRRRRLPERRFRVNSSDSPMPIWSARAATARTTIPIAAIANPNDLRDMCHPLTRNAVPRDGRPGGLGFMVPTPAPGTSRQPPDADACSNETADRCRCGRFRGVNRWVVAPSQGLRFGWRGFGIDAGSYPDGGYGSAVACPAGDRDVVVADHDA